MAKDYYKILRVHHSANQEAIKKSFKRLALKFHPDKNPNNKIAEEQFKEINEAYSILSVEQSKARYDLIRNYSRKTAATYQGYQWKTATTPGYRQKTPSRSIYKMDFGWEYVRNQLLAFAFVFIVAILVLTTQGIFEYRKQKELALKEAIKQGRVNFAIFNFGLGSFKASLDTLNNLIRDFPGSFDIRDHKRDLMKEIKRNAERNFQNENYLVASENFNIALKYDEKYLMNEHLYFRLSTCYEQLGKYEEATNVLNQIWAKDHENIILNIELGRLYTDMIGDHEKALEHFDRARDKARGILTSAYGRAYEIVLNPERVQSFYYEAYHGRALTNFRLGNYEESIKDCNWAVFFRRESSDDYHLRAINYYKLDNQQKACENLNVATSYGLLEPDQALVDYCN